MKAAIIGGGMVENYLAFAAEIEKCDLIICADGGIKHLINVGIPPHVFIGDFDSCEFNVAETHPILQNTEISRHNPIKDDTDMQLCIDYALTKGVSEIIIFAALGGRIDHELSNIYNLRYILEKGVFGMIYSDTNHIYITDKYLKIKREDGYKLSIVPLTSKVSGVNLSGLYYPLENAELSQGSSLGISNEFVNDYAEISVAEGVLLVILSKDSLNL